MKNNKQFILFFILSLLVISVVFTIVAFYQQSKQQNIRIKADALDIIDQRMKNTYTEVNSFPSGVADNLLFLSKLSDFQKITTDSDKNDDIKKDFLEFLAQSEAYYQISYITKSGNEIIRAESNGQSYKIILNLKEQDEEDIRCFNLAKNLKNGEVYVFPLTLNIKDKIIENRGDGINPQYVPILRYATPIFNQQTGKSAGIILVKVYADYFLDSIRNSQRGGEITYLIDTKGFYLANPDKNKEFSYLFDGKKDNFFTDYPLVSKDKMFKCNERHQETNEQIFTYRCIQPTTSNFEIYEGSKTIDGKLGSSYQWLLITVTNKDEGLKNLSKQKYDYLWAILIQILIQGLAFVLFLINNKLNKKND